MIIGEIITSLKTYSSLIYSNPISSYNKAFLIVVGYKMQPQRK